MKKMIALLLAAYALNATAEVKPFCRVTNLKNAQQCMERIARHLPEYEEPNEVVVAKNDGTIVKVLKALDLSEKILGKATAAEYVGAVLLHGDEHELVFFSMKKNSRATPEELFSLNLVDLQDMLVAPIEASDLFLGYDAKDFDVYEDIQYAISEAAANF